MATPTITRPDIAAAASGRVARRRLPRDAAFGYALLFPAAALITILVGYPFIRALSGIPLDPGVKAHSIIPVKQEQNIEAGDDGVVKYESAHIEGVESELVVRDVHSTQANPHTIEEVRRILHQHAAP